MNKIIKIDNKNELESISVSTIFQERLNELTLLSMKREMLN